MHLKTYLLVCILIVTIRCTQQNATTETSDSTQVKTDTTVAQTAAVAEETPVEEEPVEPDEPPIETSALFEASFDFGRLPITDDPRELSTTKAVEELIAQFNKERYVTIDMSYTHPDPVMPGTVKEEATWYYNAERKLCAANMTYKSERTTEESYYLCTNDELVAKVLDSDFYDEGAGYTSYIRIASTECPTCGVTISNDDGEGNEVAVMDQSDLNTNGNEFFNTHDEMVKTFKGVTELTKQGERYIAFVTLDSNTGVDTIKYSVDPNLVRKFFKKATVKD
jgi:hypothetical protein